MVCRGSYALVLALHLVSVVFLVGPAAMAAMASPRLVRSGNAAGLRDAAHATRLYTLLTLVTVVLGSALVGISGETTAQWSMGDLWVSASWALWLVAVAVTLLLVVPGQRAAADALDGGREAGSSVGRISAGAGVAALCWTAIVVLMVYKPGA